MSSEIELAEVETSWMEENREGSLTSVRDIHRFNKSIVLVGHDCQTGEKNGDVISGRVLSMQMKVGSWFRLQLGGGGTLSVFANHIHKMGEGNVWIEGREVSEAEGSKAVKCLYEVQ
jgi:hypothetical protein